MRYAVSGTETERNNRKNVSVKVKNRKTNGNCVRRTEKKKTNAYKTILHSIALEYMVCVYV